MIFSSSSKDFFYRAAQSALTYYITVDGVQIYSGTAFKSPKNAEVVVNVGRRISDYLESHMPDFREYDGVVVPHPQQMRVFSLYGGDGTLLEEYAVLMEWTGEWSGEYGLLTQPVNGHADPRQKLFFSSVLQTSAGYRIEGYPEFSITLDSPLEFGEESGSTTVGYVSNYSFTVSESCEWLSVSKEVSSTGDTETGALTFTYSHNPYGYGRECRVSFKQDDYVGSDCTQEGSVVNMTATQAGKYYFDFITQDYSSIGYSDTSYTVLWDTNYPYIRYSFNGSTGSAFGNGETVSFPANTGDTNIMYAFSAFTPDNQYLGAVRLVHRSAVYGSYLTIEPLESGYLALAEQVYTANTFSYSQDGGNTWTQVTPSQFSGYDSGYTRAGAVIPVTQGREVLLKGNLQSCSSYDRPSVETLVGIDFIGQFPSGGTLIETVKFNLRGNVMSLVYGDNFESSPSEAYSGGTFAWLFSTSNVVSAEKLVIPMLSLTDQCCLGMFKDCKLLTKAPVLDATVAGRKCYAYMFEGCTSLVDAPALPAETLSAVCYYRMFAYCTSIVSAPDLPAKVMAEPASYDRSGYGLGCYENMFEGCSSLVRTPAIAATTAASHCFNYMFVDCVSLAEACTILPSELKNHSCSNMFAGCTSLTAAPRIMATKVGQFSCESMFSNCTNLVSPPVLSGITTLDYACFDGMFQFCSALATAPELPMANLAERCYRLMFASCGNLSYVKCLATDTNAIQNLDATYNWLRGVKETGTFVKAASMTWASGDSGVPYGWTTTNN